MKEDKWTLYEKYPPSESCTCEVCQSYCKRPGWWTVDEARKVIEAGLSNRMMFEISPDKDFGVLSPAFKGNEGEYALQIYSNQACTFLKNERCELYELGLVPLECRYCHHKRIGEGPKCHTDIEKEWKSAIGKKLVVQWGNLTGFWLRQGLILFEK